MLEVMPEIAKYLDNILRAFRISDKPGWTHTSDAVAPVEVGLQR